MRQNYSQVLVPLQSRLFRVLLLARDPRVDHVSSLP